MRILLLLTTFFLYALPSAQSQHTHEYQRAIKFPDIPGYQTLKCDLHIHTVFSDGSVWPNIRVEEALRDGLDAIAMTEHLEYQPHKEDIPHPDRNRSYELASKSSKNDDLIIINGSEITRSMPPGHSNAIFVQDANKLLIDDSLKVFRAARQQDAFVFWNHPNWTAQADDGIARLSDFHLQLIKEGLLNGIEVVNSLNYSEEALQIALDHDLTIMGTSDIHGLIDWDYEVPHGGHRPVTLIFAKQRSRKGIKDGLVNGRTVVWFNNLLIGKKQYLVPLMEQSLSVDEATYQGDSSVLTVNIRNSTGQKFILENKSSYTFHANSDLITIKPHAATKIEVKTLKRLSSLKLNFKVLNAITAPKTHPEISLKFAVKQKQGE